MKTTLFFKRADLLIQLVSLLLPALLSLFYGSLGYLILCPMLLGVEQPVSCLFNALFLDKFIKQSGRRLYEKALVGVIVVWLLALALNGLPAGWLFILICSISPFMAFLYISVTYREMCFIAMQVDRKQYV